MDTLLKGCYDLKKMKIKTMHVIVVERNDNY